MHLAMCEEQKFNRYASTLKMALNVPLSGIHFATLALAQIANQGLSAARKSGTVSFDRSSWQSDAAPLPSGHTASAI